MSDNDALAAAATGMRVQAATLDVIAHNLANSSSAGFRPEHEAFVTFGAELQSDIGVSSAQGPLRRTDVPTDLALCGEGYFAVATPDGVCYTRDGRLAVDSHGHLSDARGNPVLGALGPARFPNGAHIDEQGRIFARGHLVDRLRIVAFDKPCNEGQNGLLVAPQGCAPHRASARVQSGYLEDSGVDAVAEMTALVAAERTYEANEKCATRTDESLRRLITDVPVVRS
jgi:flagellar basal-body rod protein FlgG